MSEPIHPDVRIGHAQLRVADLERATAFYRDGLGFEVMDMGAQAAFLSAGGYHHHIGLNTWHSAGGTPPPPGHTGLFNIAILYPIGGSWPRPSSTCSTTATTSPLPTRPPRARPCTSTSRTATVWSSTTIFPASNGPPTRKAVRSSTATFLGSWTRKAHSFSWEIGTTALTSLSECF
jgi:Glyoxalase/Bleomycin resistance protein/Dioxygenase superfamily